MPPIDELPVNVNHVDPNMHAFITNKKNIHVNVSIAKMCINNIADILAVTSNDSQDIALFTTKEGKNMYSLEYHSSSKTTLIKHKY